MAQAHGTVEDNKKRLAETIARRQKQLKVDIDSQADGLDQAMVGMGFDASSLNSPVNTEVKQAKTPKPTVGIDNQLSPVKEASLNKKQKESRERSLKEAEQREQLEAQDKEKQDDIDGFLDDSKPMIRGRAVKTLNKLVRYNGNVATLKSHVKKLVEDGAELSIEEVDKIKPMSRAAFNRATSEQQQDRDWETLPL